MSGVEAKVAISRVARSKVPRSFTGGSVLKRLQNETMSKTTTDKIESELRFDLLALQTEHAVKMMSCGVARRMLTMLRTAVDGASNGIRSRRIGTIL